MAQPLKLDRVLFATDLSPGSEPALRYAASLASRFSARIYLLHVVPPADAAADVALCTSDAERQATEAMRRVRQELLAAYDDYTIAILPGDQAARILQKAEDVNADLIVMGTSPRCPRAGGVTDTVMRFASCPVLTVPHTRDQSAELPT